MAEDYEWRQDRARDRKLRPAGAKRILALDGGGIRGLLSCGILKHLESTLAARLPEGTARANFVLADYFDFIGGTSTGSIVAAWLALGKKVADLQSLYMEMGPTIFGKPNRFGRIFVNRFDADALDAQLSEHLGDLPLDADALATGFGVTAKRMDTGSGWILTNNPKAPYWDGDDLDHPNAQYLLRHVVRASAAAPAYFDHVDIEIERGSDPGAFMDGAVAGLNNPSLAFWLYTTLPGYGLRWATGADKLLIISIGTGEYRERFAGRKLRKMAALQRAVFSLAGSIQDVAKTTTMLMQALSGPANAYPINSEVDFHADRPGEGHSHCIAPAPLFAFQRYDARLESKTLAEMGFLYEGEAYGPRIMRKLQGMDCAEQTNLNRLYEIGERVGETTVRPEHFPPAFNTDAMGGPPPAAPQPAPTLAHNAPAARGPDRWRARKAEA